jgi:hypothetical protein
MPRALILGFLLLVLTLMMATTAQQGCQDLKRSWTRLDYYDVRDMRRTVVLNPQKIAMLAPDTLAVPTSGRDVDNDYLRDPNHNAVVLATRLGDQL